VCPLEFIKECCIFFLVDVVTLGVDYRGWRCGGNKLRERQTEERSQELEYAGAFSCSVCLFYYYCSMNASKLFVFDCYRVWMLIKCVYLCK
jgi:hypothetical protein